jgi:hypothetical protein
MKSHFMGFIVIYVMLLYRYVIDKSNYVAYYDLTFYAHYRTFYQAFH